MTALDSQAIIRELREEWRNLGQYRPETTARLIAATERTGEWPLPNYRPVSPPPALDSRRGQHEWREQPAAILRHARSTYLGTGSHDATVLSFPSNLCNAKHPDRTLLCGEAPGHRGQHRAYGSDDRVIDEWWLDHGPQTGRSPEAGA